MRKFQITVNGQAYEVEVEEIGASVSAPAAAPVAPAAPAPVAAAPAPVAVAKPAPVAAKPASAPVQGGEAVKAPMPGNILEVKVTNGQSVKKGETLVILEAMKMENDIPAPRDGVVASVNVQKGATVNSGDVLVSIK